MKRKLHFLLAVGIGLVASVGWLHAIERNAGTLEELKTAINDAVNGDTINLTADIWNANATTGSAITIDKAITLNGGRTEGVMPIMSTISGSAQQNIIAVTGNGKVTIKNLCIRNVLPAEVLPAAGKGYNDITVYERGVGEEDQVFLYDVHLSGSGGIGLVNKSSNVKATRLFVDYHVWGSVNLEKKDDQTLPVFILEGYNELRDPLQIWADYKNVENWFSSTGWKGYHYYYTGTDPDKYEWIKTAWTNKYDSETKTVMVHSAIEFQNLLAGMVNDATAHSEGLVKTISIGKDLDIDDLAIAQSSIGPFQGIINVRQPVVIEGNNHKITGSFTVDTKKSYYLLKFDGKSAGSTVQNLTIDGVNATALDLITNSKTPIVLKNLTLINNTGGGLNVNSSYVEATDLVTSGNGIASVRIAVEGYYNAPINPFFTLKGNSRLGDQVKIAYNAKENPKTYNLPAAARSIDDRLKMVSIDTDDKADWRITWQLAKFRAQDDMFPALTWTNDVDNTTLSGKSLAKMTSAAELDSLFTFGGSTVDGIVWTAAEKQTLTKDITLDKSFAIVGNDKAKCNFTGAVSVVIPEDKTVNDVVFNNLTFDYQPTTQKVNERCIPVFWLKDGKTNLSVDNCIVNNKTAGYGAGYGDSSYRKMQNVFQSDSTVTGSIIIKNTTINLLANNQRAISSHGVMNVEMINTTVKGQDSGEQQHGVCVHRDNVTVTLDNSTISLSNHYGIWVIKGKGQTINIKNHSMISGFGALYLMGPSDVNVSVVDGSTLTGVTKNNGPSDSFGALILEGVMNSNVEIADSYIGTQFKLEQTAEMVPILISGNINNFPASENNTIVLKGKSVIRTLKNATNPFMVDYGRDPNPDVDKNYVIVEGSEVQFKDQNDSDCIVINNLDGSFRNAAISIVNAIDYGSVYNNAYYHWAIANSGDKVLATDIIKSKVLSSLNAGTDQFFTKPEGVTTWEAYVVPDSIVIECKDAYLVTGEKAANAFANSINDKAVFYLKQTATEFTAIAAGDNHVKVNTNTTWNHTTNANRSVEIAAGATLTINMAMPLDTVFMAEGAQLVANAAVTANAVQLAYGVEKTWKAFGFPFVINAVKNLKGEDVKTVAAASDGLWTAGIADGAPTFTVTSETATPAASCIIAADQDSTILVTSKADNNGLISLSAKAEPNAPVVTTKADGAKFQIISNPNLSDMTLTQTAYVLSEDGKTFDRMVNPTIKAFQSFVLADEGTTSTLRSLRIGDTPTGNEIVPVKGYFVETGHGTITIHTAEPTQVIVVDMLGRVYYNARVNDGTQIAVPAGIYAVNKQKVIVK